MEADTNALAVLNRDEEAVAYWLATSSIPGESSHLTSIQLAEQLGCHRNTIYAMSRREHVRERAHQMLKDTIQFDKVPRMMTGIFEKAEKDPKFALEVLKWMREWGIDPLLTGETGPKRGKSGGQTIVLNAPGGLEAAIRTIRED